MRSLVYLCFFLSGAAGLVYEVVWARRLALFLGITTWAHTAVITAFMAGLAAGAFFLGKLADRREDHLRIYGRLELAIGLYAAATPWLFGALQSLYAGMASSLGLAGLPGQLLRFCMALVALFVPTFLMGGTLPILVKGLTRDLNDLAAETGRLYGINTLGATLGAFAAGYLLLPAFGLRRTLFLTALVNLLVAVVAFWLWRRSERESRPRPKKSKRPTVETESGLAEPLPGRVGRVLLVGFAFSGFAALVYQLAWIRALTLVIGSSVYAFSATVTTFLAGLGLGSLLHNRVLSRSEGRAVSPGYRMGQAAILELATALTALVGLALIGRLPELFLAAIRGGLHESFFSLQIVFFGFSFLVMLPPTLLLGALFPLITSLWVRDARTVGRSVGTAYAANTAGTIMGALLGGLILLPTIGVQFAVMTASLIHSLVAATFWLARPSTGVRWHRPAGAMIALGAVLALVAALPPWDRSLMTAGIFYRPEKSLKTVEGRTLREVASLTELLYYHEGRDGTVAVKSSGGERILVINGKTDASSRGDLPTQVLLGQLPMLVHHSPSRVLVIGLGSGITAGSVATYESMEEMTVAEISPEVVAASSFFDPENGEVLKDPRVDLVVADARNYLEASRDLWDVIISEPSNPWISGISNLFTREAFELARSRLAPGGLMAQWCQIYNLTPGDLRTVIRTFQSVFPHVSVWIPSPGDLILLGSERAHALDLPRLEEAIALAPVRADLERIGAASPDRVIRTFLMAGAELGQFIAGAPLNTDDRPRIEFNAPRSLYLDTDVENMRQLTRHQADGFSSVPVARMVVPVTDGLDARALGLDILMAVPPGNENWQAHWLVSWEVLPTMMEDTPKAGISSQRIVAWLEPAGELRVSAKRLDDPPEPGELAEYLRSTLGSAMIEGGEVEMPCGETGWWGVSAGQAGTELRLVWTASVHGEPTHLTAWRRVPANGEERLEETVRDLAGRFRCSAGIG